MGDMARNSAALRGVCMAMCSRAIPFPAEMGTQQWAQSTSRDGMAGGRRSHLGEEEGPTGVLVPGSPRSPILCMQSTLAQNARGYFCRAFCSRGLRAAVRCSETCPQVSS